MLTEDRLRLQLYAFVDVLPNRDLSVLDQIQRLDVRAAVHLLLIGHRSLRESDRAGKYRLAILHRFLLSSGRLVVLFSGAM